MCNGLYFLLHWQVRLSRPLSLYTRVLYFAFAKASCTSQPSGFHACHHHALRIAPSIALCNLVTSCNHAIICIHDAANMLVQLCGLERFLADSACSVCVYVPLVSNCPDECRMGLLQNLSTAQIVEQLVEAKRLLAETGEDITATNIVFMGMGASPSDEKTTWQECA
jgi:hypothetical protein